MPLPDACGEYRRTSQAAPGRNRTNRSDQQKTHKLLALRPGNQGVAQAIRLIE